MGVLEMFEPLSTIWTSGVTDVSGELAIALTRMSIPDERDAPPERE